MDILDNVEYLLSADFTSLLQSWQIQVSVFGSFIVFLLKYDFNLDNALILFGSMISAKIVYIRSMTLWNDEIKMVLVVSEKMNLASDGLK